MIIALTGTPGTGKTAISRLLEKKFRIIDLNTLIINEGLHFGQDEQRGSLIADMDVLQARVDELVNSETATVIIEGHLSHLLEGTDAVIVLRTRPEVLGRRLAARDYTEEKVRENVEAEALDVILVEAVQQHKKVYEIETTDSSPGQTCSEVMSMIGLLEAGDYRMLNTYLPGRFDWSEEVF